MKHLFQILKKAAPYFGAAARFSVQLSKYSRTLFLSCLVSSAFAASNNVLAAQIVEIGEKQNHGAEVQAGDMFYQIQVLQEEVRQLRGLLEEQAYQIRQLKKSQTENYLDLDGRIAAITIAPQSQPQQDGQKPQVGASASAPAQSAGSASTAVSSDKASAKYNAAYGLLKARKLDESLVAFQAFVASYPTSSYTANAYYWMGEIHLVRNQYDEAAVEFTRVVENYPTHRKAQDARYKLGTVYYQKGDKNKAREQLQIAASGGGSAARLAQRYLDANF